MNKSIPMVWSKHYTPHTWILTIPLMDSEGHFNFTGHHSKAPILLRRQSSRSAIWELGFEGMSSQNGVPAVGFHARTLKEAQASALIWGVNHLRKHLEDLKYFLKGLEEMLGETKHRPTDFSRWLASRA